MTVRHLKIFVAVCEYGGITKASEALHIAQPSVSLTIAQMEKYYKIQLFERINQRLVLTEMGKTLLIKAKETLRSFSDFENTAVLGSEKPTLHIGSSLTLGKTVIPKLIKKINEEIPEIEVHVEVNKTAVIEKEAEQGNLDFCIVEGKLLSPYLDTYEFGGDRLVAVCHRDFEAKESLTLSELVKLPLVLREKGSASRTLFESVLSEKGLTASPYYESVSNQCIVVALNEGLGVSVLPEGIVSFYIKSGILKEIKVLDADFARKHYIAIHKNKRFNKAQRRALDICMNMYKDVEI